MGDIITLPERSSSFYTNCYNMRKFLWAAKYGTIVHLGLHQRISVLNGSCGWDLHAITTEHIFVIWLQSSKATPHHPTILDNQLDKNASQQATFQVVTRTMLSTHFPVALYILDKNTAFYTLP